MTDEEVIELLKKLDPLESCNSCQEKPTMFMKPVFKNLVLGMHTHCFYCVFFCGNCESKNDVEGASILTDAAKIWNSRHTESKEHTYKNNKAKTNRRDGHNECK